MTISGLHSAADTCRNRQTNGGASDLNWSYKGERVDTIKWTRGQVKGEEKLCRAALDVSDAQFSYFCTKDNQFIIRLLNNEPTAELVEQITLERRLLEFQNLNVIIEDLKFDFPDLLDIICAYDHPSHRRHNKGKTLSHRRKVVVRKELTQKVQKAIKEYRHQKREGEEPQIPQIKLDDGNFQFAPFSPPTDEELDPDRNLTGLRLRIHQEALRLVRHASHVVSNSEADSICRDASAGDYLESSNRNTEAIHSFRLATEPPPDSSNWKPTDLSMILGKDSDHLVLNDATTAAFILGLARNYACRATDLRARRDHPEDWSYRNRRAQTFAAALLGCDESPGLHGYTVAGVARAYRQLKPKENVTTRLQNEGILLGFINRVDEVVEVYSSTHGEHAQEQVGSTLLSPDPRLVSWENLEEAFSNLLNKVVTNESNAPEPSFTLQYVTEVFIGLVESKGTLVDKQELNKLVSAPLVEEINEKLKSIYTVPGQRNHLYSSLVSKPPNSSPPNPSPQPSKHRPFAVRIGPDSRSFLDAQRTESQKLVQAQTGQPEDDRSSKSKKKVSSTAPKSRARGKEKGKEKGKRKAEEEGTGQVKAVKSRKPGVGVGLKEFRFAMSTISFPFRVESINRLVLSDIEANHQFHYDFIAVLDATLRLWLNECPLLVENISAVLAFHWECAPTLLDQWSSAPQKFGDLAGAFNTALSRYYDRYPLSANAPPRASPQEQRWLAKWIEKYEKNVPSERLENFRKRVSGAGLSDDELRVMTDQEGKDDPKMTEVDIAMAIVIRERWQREYPPSLLRNSAFVALNMTTCGTGFMNATDSRAKQLVSFVANNLLDTLLSFPSRIVSNPYDIPAQYVTSQLEVVKNHDPSIITKLQSLSKSKRIVRLVKLRIQAAPLLDPESSTLPPRPKGSNVQMNDGDEVKLPLDENEELEEEEREEEETSNYGDEDEVAFDETAREWMGATSEQFEDKLRQELLAGIGGEGISSQDFYEAAGAYARLIAFVTSYSIVYIRKIYHRAVEDLPKKESSKWKDFETVGDLVASFGGKVIKFQTREKFLDSKRAGDGEHQVEEVEEVAAKEESRDRDDDEDDEEDGRPPRVSPSKKVVRRIVLGLLPLYEKPFARFKPRSCTLNPALILSFTKSAAGSNYLPPLIMNLLDRIAVEARKFNSELGKDFTVEDFKIPSPTDLSNLPPNSAERHALEQLIRLSGTDGFVKLQLKHPNKILSSVNDYWPRLNLEAEESEGIFVVRPPTDQVRTQLEAQCKTVRQVFKQLGLNSQEDIEQVSHEVLDKIFRPKIGHRLYHGNFTFDGLQINALVFDPRYFRPRGAKKYGAQVEDLGWRAGVESLLSDHPTVLSVYEKIKGKPPLKVLRDTKVRIDYKGEGKSRQPGQPKFKIRTHTAPLPLLFEIHREVEQVSGNTTRPETTTKLRYRQSLQASEPSRLDPRQGLFLPFKQPYTDRGVETLKEWGAFVGENFYDTSHAPSTTSQSSTGDARFNVHQSRVSLSSPQLDDSPSAAQASTSTSEPSSSTHSSGQFSAPPLASSRPASQPGAGHLPPPTLADEMLATPTRTVLSPHAQAFEPTGGGGASAVLDQDGDTEMTLSVPAKPQTRAFIFAPDQGGRLLIDGALIPSDGGPIKLIRLSSGKSIKQDQRARTRLRTILPFESRSRLTAAVKTQVPSESNQLSVVLRRGLPTDPSDPAKPLPVDRISLESQTLILRPLLQAGHLHTPDRLHSTYVYKERGDRLEKLTSEARKRWNELIPEPEDGVKVVVAYIVAYGNVSAGKGYGRAASKSVVDADLRALRSMEWIILKVVRSSECYSSKVCSKPGCGASLVYVCRLTNLSDILRILVCLRCFRVVHRDDNGALNTARIAIAAAQGVLGNLLTPTNAELLGYTFRGTNKEVARLKSELKNALGSLSEEERKNKLENLKESDSLLGVIEKLVAVGDVDYDEEGDGSDSGEGFEGDFEEEDGARVVEEE